MKSTKSRFAAAIALCVLLLPACDFFAGIFGPAEVDAPYGLAAGHGSSAEGIPLSWTAIQGAASYVVYRSPSFETDASYERIGAASSASYLDSSVPADQNYWYKVSAISAKGKESPMSGAAYGSRKGSGGAAAIPYNVRATEGDWGRIIIRWSVDPSVERVAIYSGRAADGSDLAFMANASGGTYDDSSSALLPGGAGSLAGVKLHFRLKGISASDANAMSAYSQGAMGYAFGGAASAPGGLAVSQGSYSTRVHLSWDASEKASGYYAYRTDYLGGPVSWSRTLRGSTQADDDQALPGQRYYYAVQAFANATPDTIYSDPCLPVIGYAQVYAGLSAPNGLASTRVSRYAVCLGWNASGGATGYRLYRSPSADGTFDYLGDSAGTLAYTDYGLSPSATYHYRVSAYSSAGESALSPALAATTAASSSLLAPTGLGAQPAAGDPVHSLALSWTASANASGYRVYRAASADGSYSPIAETSLPGYVDSGLQPDRSYFYKLSAFNPEDDSPQTASFPGLTDPPEPAAPSPCSADTNGTGHIHVFIPGTAYAHHYLIQRRQEEPSPWVDLTGNLPAESSQTVYEDSSAAVKPGIRFLYRVAAVNRIGQQGPWSAEFPGGLSPWAFGTPLLSFMSSGNDDSPMSASFGWTASADPRVTAYRIYRAEVDTSNDVWTYGSYATLATVTATARSDTYEAGDHDKIFSYIVAATDAADGTGGFGPRSRPLDIMASRSHAISLANTPPYGLSSAKKYGMVYGSNTISYTFTLPAATTLFVYLQHYNAANLYDARISIKHANGSAFAHASQPATFFVDMPVNRYQGSQSLYRQDGYPIHNESANETVTLEVSLPPAYVPANSVNYFVWVAETPVVRTF
jgi:fibronectin type 3 domain-containing protein